MARLAGFIRARGQFYAFISCVFTLSVPCCCTSPTQGRSQFVDLQDPRCRFPISCHKSSGGRLWAREVYVASIPSGHVALIILPPLPLSHTNRHIQHFHDEKHDAHGTVDGWLKLSINVMKDCARRTFNLLVVFFCCCCILLISLSFSHTHTHTHTQRAE